MPLRESMSSIIKEMRIYGAAAQDDEFDGETYWTDMQLQDIADNNSRSGLIKLERVDPAYLTYRVVAPKNVVLENNFTVYSETGGLLATPFEFVTSTREFVFETALFYDEYQAYGRVIDINEALAQLWQAKADQRFNYIDWKAQNNKMNMAQEYQHCVERAMFYRSKKIRSFDRAGRGKWSI